MDTVYISGRFVNKENQKPIDGPIELVPSALWLEDEDGIAFATLAPATITKQGKFRIAVTACHARDGVYDWFYQIRCPMGVWSIHPDGEDGTEVHLKDMLPTRN